MNVDNGSTEPVTDLGLSLDYSNHCIQSRLNEDPGASANAASRVEMAFVASNPLSELVWSPHNGLSLRCADCSATEKQPYLLWGSGPNNSVSSPPERIMVETTNTDKLKEDGNLITMVESFNMKGEVGEIATLAWSPRCIAGILPVCGSSAAGTAVNTEEMNSKVEASVLAINRKDDNGSLPLAAIPDKKESKISGSPGPDLKKVAGSLSLKMNESGPNMANMNPISGDFDKVFSFDPTDGSKDVGRGNQKLRTQIALVSEVCNIEVEQCRAPDALIPNLISLGGKDRGLTSMTEKESKDIVKTGSTRLPLEKLESTDENDINALLGENACNAARQIEGPESPHEIKSISQQDEDRLPGEKNIGMGHTPTNSRIQMYRRKGKEKALSDGDVNMLEVGEGSRESVESCNSAGLFATGKRRGNFEQQFVTGSKRVKRQIQESPGSTSRIRHVSSFMNWISNMMKGFPKSDGKETPSLALTLAHPNQGDVSCKQKLVSCKKNKDPGCINMGFQSIFQSLYCPNAMETQMLNAGNVADEGSSEPESSTKQCDVNVASIACHRSNNNSCTRYLLSNDRCKQSTSGNGASLSSRPKTPSANFDTSGEKKNNSIEIKVSSNLASSMDKVDASQFNSFLGEHKATSADNSDLPHAVKAPHEFNDRRVPPRSLWISRFCPKNSASTSKLDRDNQSTVGARECLADRPGLLAHYPGRLDTTKENNSKTRDSSGENPLNIMDREVQNCSTNTKASFGVRGIKRPSDQIYAYKLNPILPSQRFKSSEAMASIFARRLDAIKHIIPLDATGNADRAAAICFFCGRRGHHLQDCSKITESELEDLLRSISSYDGAAESPSLCIRCFQLNHWAVACPTVSSRRQQSGSGASIFNNCQISKIHLDKENEGSPKPLENRESQSKAANSHIVGSEKSPRIELDPNSYIRLDRMVTSENFVSNPVNNHIPLSVANTESKENQIIPLHSFFNRQTSDLQKGIFNGIKRLRLSRTDILKWVNSQISLSQLEGFFLRLRLGKWETGLGGTGYYVACINGAQREKSPQGSKNPISVNIGGIKCLVESQYVSNHDFLEDELMAWWSAASRSGSKIPSEEELRVKLEERKKLVF